MKHFEQLSFDRFWPLVESHGFFQPSDRTFFSQVIGYHIYADLYLNLDLAAAQDSSDAMKFLNLLEDFTVISDRCASLVGARVLEVQGGRNHFLLPSNDPVSVLPKLLQFSSALTRTVYDELKPKAGNDWQGFSMAADHGPAILIPSPYGGGSLVSLGNAANQPAKKLGRGVDSGHLAIPLRIGKSLPGAKPSGDWSLIDVNKPLATTQDYFDDQLTESMRNVARGILENRSRRGPRDFVNNTFTGISFSTTPLRTRGMCMRADVDGFTPTVESAIKNGKGAQLVQQFTELMQYPIEFTEKLGRRHVELPWAGDCCTMLIQPGSGETVERMRATLPVEAGRLWHGLAHENGKSERWRSSLSGAKWALGLACGDAAEGGNGHAIVSEFPAAGRTFRVLVGWCARRAKDAQETSGICGDDTAIPIVDYQNLESVFKPLFKLASSLYRSASYNQLRQAGNSAAHSLRVSAPQQIVGVSAALPAPRPYGRRN